MNSCLKALCILLSLAPLAEAGKTVNVRGYYRKDGTYVRPHTRSSPGSGLGYLFTAPPLPVVQSIVPRRAWVEGYYRADGTYVRGHWRNTGGAVDDEDERPSPPSRLLLGRDEYRTAPRTASRMTARTLAAGSTANADDRDESRTPPDRVVIGRVVPFGSSSWPSAYATHAETRGAERHATAHATGSSPLQDEDERKAAAMLRLARKFMDERLYATAKKWLDELVAKYPMTAAAREARDRLKQIEELPASLR